MTGPQPVEAALAVTAVSAIYPSWSAVGVNWLTGFDFEIKVITRIP